MIFDISKWLKEDGSAAFLVAKVICDAIGSMPSSPNPYGNYDWVFDVSKEIRESTPSKKERLKIGYSILFEEINRLEKLDELNAQA